MPRLKERSATPPAQSSASPPLAEIPGTPWRIHDAARPHPRAITPGATPGAAPSDAIVLFDGKDLSKWAHSRNGQISDAKWPVKEGYFETGAGTGSIVTREKFGDVQLHVEFATPSPGRGASQDRGNSGVIFMGRYEVQVLDSFENVTYADGQAAAIYGEYPPLGQRRAQPGRVADLRHRVRGAKVQRHDGRRARLPHRVLERRARPAPAAGHGLDLTRRSPPGASSSAILRRATTFQKSGSWCSALRVKTAAEAGRRGRTTGTRLDDGDVGQAAAATRVRSTATIAGEMSTAMTCPQYGASPGRTPRSRRRGRRRPSRRDPWDAARRRPARVVARLAVVPGDVDRVQVLGRRRGALVQPPAVHGPESGPSTGVGATGFGYAVG